MAIENRNLPIGTWTASSTRARASRSSPQGDRNDDPELNAPSGLTPEAEAEVTA